jgi:predicted transcriptional regulator
MALTDRQLLASLSRMPFVDSAELAGVLGEPHATIHRHLVGLLSDGIVGRVSHGSAHLPSSKRYYLTAEGIRQATRVLDFDTHSDFVRAYPMSREWLTLLIRRMDAVASIYRLASSLSLGGDGLRTRVEFHRRGRFDATVTLHDGRDFGVVRQGLALRRRSLHDRLRALAEHDYSRRPDVVLILVPGIWERRLTTRFCEERNLDDCYVAVESRAALERRDRRLWCKTSWVLGSTYHTLDHVTSQGSPGRRPATPSPERKRASIPRLEQMVEAAPAFGLSSSEKRTLDLITDHPMVPREHLATWLGVSKGRVSQMMHNLVKTWGLIERHGKRGDTRYTLSAEGIRYVTHRDRAELPTTRGIWSTELTTDKEGRLRYVGHRIETWARQTKHADGITWFLSELAAEARADGASELQWSVPTARSDRAYNWGRSAIAPDAVGHLLTDGHHIPFYLEHELRARHPQGVIARLDPYESYYWSPDHEEDQPPYPVTLFVVDTEEVEDTYVRTAASMNRMSLPILVSCIPVLSTTGILQQSWRPLWEAESPRMALSQMREYRWDSLYHVMRPRPVEGR